MRRPLSAGDRVGFLLQFLDLRADRIRIGGCRRNLQEGPQLFESTRQIVLQIEDICQNEE